jgi:hypothetical protein
MNWNKFLKVFALLFLLGAATYAQVLTPTKWSWKASSNSVNVGDQIDLIF